MLPRMGTLKDINDHLAIYSGLLASILILVPAVRRGIVRVFKFMASLLAGGKNQKLILEKLTAMDNTLTANGGRLQAIEKEIGLTGDRSVKDTLKLLLDYRRHDFWRAGRPVLELDSQCQVTLVSEAVCRLFGVSSPDDLMRRSWLRFVDPGCVEDMLAAFEDTAEHRSEFIWRVKLRTMRFENRGEWEFRASLVTADKASGPIYAGSLTPVDAVAKDAAKSVHWTS